MGGAAEFQSMRDFPHGVEKSPMRVLIVEDELLIRWSVAETLGHDGHSVVEAASGAAAIAALEDARSQSTPIDAVILDYRLPDSNDLSLLARIRKLSPRSVVIMMTAFGTPEMTQAALNLGVFAVMNKPFEMRDLSEMLQKASAEHGG